MRHKQKRRKEKIKAPLHPYFRTLVYISLFFFFLLYKPFENETYNQAFIVALGILSFFYVLKIAWKHPGRNIRTISGTEPRRY
jgi:L-asparagine transporter-like permease